MTTLVAAMLLAHSGPAKLKTSGPVIMQRLKAELLAGSQQELAKTKELMASLRLEMAKAKEVSARADAMRKQIEARKAADKRRVDD